MEMAESLPHEVRYSLSFGASAANSRGLCLQERFETAQPLFTVFLGIAKKEANCQPYHCWRFSFADLRKPRAGIHGFKDVP